MRKILAFLAALVLASLAGMFVASPANAAWSQCYSGDFCLWTGRDAGGDFHSYSLATIRAQGGIDLPGSIDNASDSWRNRTGVTITIFDNADCYFSGWYRNMVHNQQATSQGSDWGSKVSSIADSTTRSLPC